jgi:hypothetical protein
MRNNNGVDLVPMIILMAVALLCAVAFSGCAGSKPYYPGFWSPGQSIQTTCKDVIFEHAPPSCADLGWCAQHGYALEMDTKDGDLCTAE